MTSLIWLIIGIVLVGYVLSLLWFIVLVIAHFRKEKKDG